MQKTIVIAHPGAELYGSDRMMVETAIAFRDAGNRVLVVTPNDGPLHDHLKQAAIESRILNVPPIRKELLRKPYLAPRFLYQQIIGFARSAVFLRRLSPDAIYINTIIQPVWAMSATALRIPSITHVREIEDSLPKALSRILLAPLRLSRSVICNSKATREWVLANNGGDLRSTSVVYNGKDWSPYRPTVGAPENPNKEETIALVGRISPRKGQDIAIQAISELRKRGHAVRLELTGGVFPGYEWYSQELLAAVETERLHHVVDFRPFAENVGESYARARYVIVPSRQEPFGTVAIEGMAAGCAVIVARTEGLAEIVEHGVNGLTFDPESPISLADQIESLIVDEGLRRRITEYAVTDVDRRFSAASYQSEMAEQLARATGR